MKKGYPWPTDPGYPAAPATPFWRNRHLRMGEGLTRTAPPSKVQGPPDPDRVTPYSEVAPSSALGGTYDQHARAIGLDEPPTAAVLNRPVYDESCALDQIAERCVAVPAIDSVAIGGPVDRFAFPDVVYLGASGTAVAPADLTKRPRTYIELREPDGVTPVTDTATGDMVYVADVLSVAGGISFYESLPDDAEVFPMGKYGVIAVFSTIVIANDTIQFVSAFPDGVPPAPDTDPVGLINYSLFERLLRGGQTPGGAFASTEESIDGAPPAPDLVRTNRNLITAGWLAGDIVYSSRFAYNPVITLTATVGGAKQLLHGEPSFGYDPLEGYDLRLLGLARSDVHSPALTIYEPVGAVLRGFDEANALFRAADYHLRGTTLFDARGRGYDPLSAKNPFAGFLFRKATAFNSATVVPLDAPCSLAGSVVTLSVPNQFYDNATGYRHLILGIDLLELTSGGSVVGLFAISNFPAFDKATITELDGSATAAAFGVGTLRVYRTHFLSAADGLWPVSANAPWRAAGVFVGENMGVIGGANPTIPLALHAAGGFHLAQGFSGPWDSFLGGSGVGPFNAKIFEIAARISGWLEPGDIGFGMFAASPDAAWYLGERYTNIAVAPPNHFRRFESRLWTDFDWDIGTGPFSGGQPRMRFLAFSGYGTGADPALSYCAAAALAVEPNGDLGIDDLVLNSVRQTSLFLGGPGDDLGVDPALMPAFGYVTAQSGLTVGTNMLIAGVHRGLAPDVNDMWLRLSEGVAMTPLPPTVDPAYCRLEVAWAAAAPVGRAEPKFNYGWHEWRTFVHHCPLVAAHPGIFWAEIAAVAPPSSVFVPVPAWTYWKGEGAIDIERWINHYSGATQVNTDARLSVSVNLPDGAEILYAYVLYRFEDAAALTSAMYVWLDRQQFDWSTPVSYVPGAPPPPPPALPISPLPGAASILTGWLPVSTVPPGVGCYNVRAEFTGVAGSAVVNNQDYSYTIHIKSGKNGLAAAGYDHYVYGVRVVYRMKDFLPA